MVRFLCLLLLVNTAPAADNTYDLAGRVKPAARASVTLFGTSSPFTVSGLTEENGAFAFHKLEPGAYTIAVFFPDRGEARRTVEVGPGTADPHRRVTVTLTFEDSDFNADVMRRRHTVSTHQLAIPEKALREYENARKALSSRDVEAAVKSLEQAVETAPQFSAAWNELGTIAYQTQKFQRAEECFREALLQDPQAYEPLVNLGGVLVTLNRTEESLTYNTYAVLTRPNDALAQSQLGLSYFQAGNFDLALKHLGISRQLDPAHFSCPQLTMAEIHLRRGDQRAAADDLEDFLKYHPDWPQAAKMRESILQFRQ